MSEAPGSTAADDAIEMERVTRPFSVVAREYFTHIHHTPDEELAFQDQLHTALSSGEWLFLKQADEQHGAGRSARFVYDKSAFARGGNSEVHLGYDYNLGKLCAVKLADRPPATNGVFHPDVNSMEAKILAKTDIPGVMKVYDYVEQAQAGKDAIVMEYMDPRIKPALSALIQPGRKIPLSNVDRMVTSMSRTLKSMTDRGVAYLDLKPSNVFYDTQSETDHTREAIQFGDFGDANKVIMNSTPASWSKNIIFGTYSYLSPERIYARSDFYRAITEENRKVFFRSDTFVLATMTYELLCGNKLFTPNTSNQQGLSEEQQKKAQREQILKNVQTSFDKAALEQRMIADGFSYPERLYLVPVLAEALESDPLLRTQTPQEFSAQLSEAFAKITEYTERRTVLSSATRPHH